MVQFLIKRLIGLVFVILCVTIITFLMGAGAPGDPIRSLLGQHFTHTLYIQLKHDYGLDQPLYIQYFTYLSHLVRFDFGLSFSQQDQPVWDILKSGLPISLELGFLSLVLQLLIGIPLGILSAVKANTWIDTTNMGIMLVLYAIPVFVMAVIFRVIIVNLDLLTNAGWPPTGWGNAWQYTPTDLQYKLAPVIVLTVGSAAYIARLARTSMLEVLRQDYVRTARAKGLLERVVVYRHALRNGLIPMVTVLGFSLGFLVTGSFFIENIFNIPGIAYLTISSVNTRDYPVIQATTVILAIAVVLGNLVSDILYTVVDPRIKVE